MEFGGVGVGHLKRERAKQNRKKHNGPFWKVFQDRFHQKSFSAFSHQMEEILRHDKL